MNVLEIFGIIWLAEHLIIGLIWCHVVYIVKYHEEVLE